MIQAIMQKTGISKEVWTAAAVVAGILLITLIMNWKKKRKKEREERQEIARRMQEDALNRSLENPFSKEEIFEKNKRPIHVKYVKNASTGESVSTGMYQLTEINDLSQKTYMYRVEEAVTIGKQYGKMLVASGTTGNEEIFGRIFYYQKANYIRSEGTQKITIKRKGKEAIVNRSGIKLKDGDIFVIEKTAYQIRFMNRGRI